MKIKNLLLLVLAILVIVPSLIVNASVSTQIIVGGEELEFDYKTMNNHNKNNSASFAYTDEYPDGLLTLNNYTGGMIEINRIVGTGTVETTPKTITIKLEGDNTINAESVAISSNIALNIIGSGSLKTEAISLHNDSINVTIDPSTKVELLQEDNNSNEEKEESEDKVEYEEKNDVKDTLITIAIICFILLCVFGCVFLLIGICKNLKK